MLNVILSAVFCAQTRPNIIMMVVDDLGWNDVSWRDQFGQIDTPKLDALRRTGITLDQYYGKKDVKKLVLM